MAFNYERFVLKVRRLLKGLIDPVVGLVTVALFKLSRRTDPFRLANFSAGAMRRIGPWLPEHRVGRANLTAAFPEKSAEEIERILLGVWDNVGRVAGEFVHLDRLWDPIEYSGKRIMPADADVARLQALRDDGKPALVFSAHLGNWELPALAATALGLNTAILYRRPNLGAVADAVTKMRAGLMGKLISTGPEALFKVSRELEAGCHVGMLVDQYYVRGVDVMFFGRSCKANPTIARLARHFDCPIHGTRAIRLAGDRFQLEVTEAIQPPRAPNGQIDIAGTMQVITSIVEGWVREYPEQWLWLHRRWR